MDEIKDSELYRELCKPFASRKEAGEAVGKFFDAVREARKANKIPDAVLVVQLSYMEDGKERAILFTSSNGHHANAVTMLAQAYGAARKESELVLDALVAAAEES